MKRFLLSILFLITTSLCYGGITELLYMSSIEDEVSKTRKEIEKAQKGSVFANNIEILYLWNGQMQEGTCTCLKRNELQLDGMGLPDFTQHGAYCPFHDWTKFGCSSTISYSSSTSIEDILKTDSDDNKIVLIYRFKSNKDLIYVERVVFDEHINDLTNEATITIFVVFVGIPIVVFIILVIACRE